jgi:hypothetical protein
MVYHLIRSKHLASFSAALARVNIMPHSYISRTPTSSTLTITSNTRREAMQAHVHPKSGSQEPLDRPNSMHDTHTRAHAHTPDQKKIIPSINRVA